MDGYPLDLILTAAIASASIFLGSLPTKTTSSDFFALVSLRLTLAWIAVAILSPLAILHYPLIFSLITFIAWWKFRSDDAFDGKLWLWLASGLGISLGVVLILAVTNRAWPDIFPYAEHYFLLASIYLGGAILGIAWYCLILTHHLSTNSGITHGLLRRQVGLLLILTLLRAVVLAGELFWPGWSLYDPVNHFYYRANVPAIAILPSLLLIPIAIAAYRATHLSSRILPTRALILFCFFGLGIEILIRLLVL